MINFPTCLSIDEFIRIFRCHEAIDTLNGDVVTEFWTVPGYKGRIIGTDGSCFEWAVHEAPNGQPYVDVWIDEA